MAAAVTLSIVVGFSFGFLFLLRQYVQLKWGKCKSKTNMKGKTVIVTGANSGLGKMTALELAKREARIILACRNVVSGKEAVANIRRQIGSCDLVVKHLDLSSFASIHSFVRDVVASEARVDVLINNAAIGWCPFALTEEGIEVQFGVNHLGHFLLTNLLLDLLEKSSPSRIVIVSSALYRDGDLDEILDSKTFRSSLACGKTYDPGRAYANSKLATVLFGQELARRLRGTNIDVLTVSPGFVWTNLGRHRKLSLLEKLALGLLAVVLVRTPFQGCQTVLHCVLSEEVRGQSGAFFQNCTRVALNEQIVDEKRSKLLWDVSAKLAKLNETDKTTSLISH